MKIIETIFLILSIAVPSFFIYIITKKINKFKRNKSFRNYMIKATILSLIINISIFGVIKINFNNPSNEKSLEGEKINANNKNLTEKGYEIIIKDGATYVDGHLIANKTFSLPSDYVPQDTYQQITSDNCAECINKEAYEAYIQMKNDATGMTLWIASGYRSYNYQNGLYNSYVNRSGKIAADTYSARPGHSEHQTGLAFDLNTVDDSFANTKEGKWINENCHKYGFIIRYPQNKDSITGYKYEPWHLRYVGTELSEKLYNSGSWITMEEYFGITSVYEN